MRDNKDERLSGLTYAENVENRKALAEEVEYYLDMIEETLEREGLDEGWNLWCIRALIHGVQKRPSRQ